MVAFSGGVDSTFVLKVAQETIGDRVLALTTTSPTMPDDDRLSALEMARLIGARHLVIESNELEIPGYARNPIDRCYLCKHNLFTVCEAKARELQIDDIVDGLNLDDLARLSPWYQGRLREARASSVGRSRDDVRRTSASCRARWVCRRGTGLRRLACRRAFPTARRSRRTDCARSNRASACSMRWAFALRACAFMARSRGSKSKPTRLRVCWNRILALTIDSELKQLGFRFVTVDLKGFRSGSLNEGLPAATAAPPAQN